jgi:hypothetical protein
MADSLEIVARAKAVEEKWGHPDQLWTALRDQVQDHAVVNFDDVTDQWLELIWCLDQFRIEGVPPIGMGKLTITPGRRLDGIYRGKGNWFATLLSLLLQNRTGEPIRSRGGIVGFSQEHQIDIAWPDRLLAPITCAETKLTGGPAYGDNPARGAMSDWSNRRKELKFAATDLKLARRDQSTSIGHWDVWRQKASPLTFFLWGARLRPQDSAQKMAVEIDALLKTYLDGAGVLAWRERETGDGYEAVALPSSPKIEDIDTALWRISDHISGAVASGEHTKRPVPTDRVASQKLLPDR